MTDDRQRAWACGGLLGEERFAAIGAIVHLVVVVVLISALTLVGSAGVQTPLLLLPDSD